MMSEAQHEEKLERVKKVVETFLISDNLSISKLSKLLNISSSTIQRDLNDVDFIQIIYGDEAKQKLEQISLKLKENKALGLSRGGTISTTNNVPTRDANGKFTGNKKR